MGSSRPPDHAGIMEGFPLPICLALWRDAGPMQVDGEDPLLLEDLVWQSCRDPLAWPCVKKGKGTCFCGHVSLDFGT